MNLFSLLAHLSLSLHLLAPLLLVVLSLHFLEFTSESLDFVLVLVHLGLVHVEFGRHCLHLVRLLFQVLLVNGELFGNFGTGLPGKQVFKLNVEFLLLLNGDILLNDLFRLLDETFLEGHDLLEQLVRLWIRALQLSPPVVVKGIFEFLRESLHLQTLLLESIRQPTHLFLVLANLSCFTLFNLEFTLVSRNLILQQPDIVKSLRILHFALAQRDLQNLDLLVQQGQLVIPANQLRAQVVPLHDNLIVLRLSLLMLQDSRLDQLVQRLDLFLLFVLILLGHNFELDFRLELLLSSLQIGRFQTKLHVLLRQGLLFLLEFVLELLDGVLGDSEFATKFDHLVIRFIHLLRVKVTVRTDNLIQILLLFKLVFVFEILLFEFSNEVLLQFEFLNDLLQISVRLVCLLGLLIHLSLQLANILEQHLNRVSLRLDLVGQIADHLHLALQFTLVFRVDRLNFGQVGLEHVPVTLQLHNVRLLLVSLLFEPLKVAQDRVHNVLGKVLLANSVKFCLFSSLVHILNLLVFAIDSLILALHLLA